MKIAIDMMGGDSAPDATVDGACQVLAANEPLERLVLVGQEDVIAARMAEQGYANDPRIEIVHASQRVEMSDKSAVALRAKRDSSITVAAELMKQGKIDGIVSAGHTGAAVTATVVKNRMLPGVDRPGIVSPLPSQSGPWALLDCGANLDCKPRHLAQYALLGEAYARTVLDIAEPRVGILNVGEEDVKGNELIHDAMELLKRLPIDYVGCVEGDGLYWKEADVVVCEGFVGNCILKTSEGLAKVIASLLKERLKKTPLRMAGALLSKNAFRELKEVTDYAEYGGAPLLGLNGTCIIAHGSATGKALHSAVRVAMQMVRSDMNTRVSEKIENIDWGAILPAVDGGQ